MEAEHTRIDPQLDAVDQALTRSDAVRLTESVQALADGLTGHMQHEESTALPLVETFLGPGGWTVFGRAIRRTQGLRAGAEYLPWLLDDAPIATQAEVLRLLPPPVRLLYRLVWAPKYRSIPRWNDHAAFDSKPPRHGDFDVHRLSHLLPDQRRVPRPATHALAASADRS